MNCITKNKNGAEILLDYGAQKLNPEKTAELERHAQSCEECRGLMRAQRSVWHSLDEFAPPEVSADFDQRLYARIAQEQRIPAWRQWLSRGFESFMTPLWKPALASALAGAVLITGLFVHPLVHSGSSQNASSAQNQADNGVRVESKTEGHVDLDQVEQALEDLDLLQPASGSPSASRM